MMVQKNQISKHIQQTIGEWRMVSTDHDKHVQNIIKDIARKLLES